MSNSTVVPFQFGENEVRTLLIDNEPWFVARDVCEILGLENITNALVRIPDNHKGVNSINTLGGKQEMKIISEPGLYRLVLRSDKPQAEPFMEWVTAEVLPSIRKTGSYSLSHSNLLGRDVASIKGVLSAPGLGEQDRWNLALSLFEEVYGVGTGALIGQDSGKRVKQLAIKAKVSWDGGGVLLEGRSYGDGKYFIAIGRVVQLSFIHDCCIIKGGAGVSLNTLYAAFCRWFASIAGPCQTICLEVFEASFSESFPPILFLGEPWYVGISMKEEFLKQIEEVQP